MPDAGIVGAWKVDPEAMELSHPAHSGREPAAFRSSIPCRRVGRRLSGRKRVGPGNPVRIFFMVLG